MSRTAARTHNAANFATLQQRLSEQERALAARRRAAIKAVKAKQRQLGLDDATYRALLHAHTGKTSSTALTLTELGVVCGYRTSQCAVAPGAGKAGQRRPQIAPDRAALRAKVAALMGDLRTVGEIRDTEAYLSAICRKNGWCSAVDFADPYVLHKLVGALSCTLRAKRTAAQRTA